MREQIFVVTKTLASFLEEGELVRITEFLEDSIIIEKADTNGLITSIEISASMRRHLHLVYEEYTS
tara:strand:- start:613 stop:810 length:198 start_codon:yes stop_codon:yes gene_type:complete